MPFEESASWEEKAESKPTRTCVLVLSVSTNSTSSVEAQRSVLFCYGS